MTSSSPYTKASTSLAVSSTSVEAIGYVWALSGLCSEQGVQDVQDPSYFLLVRIDDRDWCHLPKLRVIPITEKWLISTGLDEIFGAHHRKIGDRQIQLNDKMCQLSEMQEKVPTKTLHIKWFSVTICFTGGLSSQKTSMIEVISSLSVNSKSTQLIWLCSIILIQYVLPGVFTLLTL